MSKQAAEYLRRFLDLNKITITEFAEKVGLSRFTIHKYLSGSSISKKNAKKLAAVLFIDENKLVD